MLVTHYANYGQPDVWDEKDHHRPVTSSAQHHPDLQLCGEGGNSQSSPEEKFTQHVNPLAILETASWQKKN